MVQYSKTVFHCGSVQEGGGGWFFIISMSLTGTQASLSEQSRLDRGEKGAVVHYPYLCGMLTKAFHRHFIKSPRNRVNLWKRGMSPLTMAIL